MQRIPIVLQKLNELAEQGEKNTAIEIDLMLDYTRVLYADLLEWRKKAVVKMPIINEPTLAEMAAAFAKPQAAAHEIQNPIFVDKKPAEKRDIRNGIGINDKFLFMSELFGNNKEAYENALDEINEFDTYQQAFNWLQTQYYWEEAEETTQSFYNILNLFFSAR